VHKKTLTILGSTGSIGRQTLEVAEPLGMQIRALTANSNIELLEEQIRKYSPAIAAVYDETAAEELAKKIKDTPVRILKGMDGIIEAAGSSGADIIVTAIAGTAGLQPTIAAVKIGKRVAIANKEPLVCAGELVMRTAREHNTEIIPVDSEHSAIYQCLAGQGDGSSAPRGKGTVLPPRGAEEPSPRPASRINKIILTASGGPFRGMTREQLEKITPEMALRHPNWSMGKKVTIDSATLMNKGLEIIEAIHLFGVTPEQIEVVIHPESIIHSMVEFTDGSVIAQLSNPDMRLPIQYALTYPDRKPTPVTPLNITQIQKLTFEKPDLEAFPCLRLAMEAARTGTAACAALNEANEEAVDLFLENKLTFNGIAEYIAAKLQGVTKC